MALNDQSVWFITGCSSGFGRELARQVLSRGWRAVVTARDVSTLTELVAGYEDTALVLTLDVTSPRQVSDAVARAQERFSRIDVLVNNAGYGYLAAAEEGEDDAVRAMFETNVFGLFDVTKAVLPGMRKHRSGLIINISSIGGLVGFGATGYYHATKFAVEGFSESLAIEVKPLGIDVLIVEPGPFRTNWAGPSIKQSAVRIADYEATAGERRKETAARSGRQVGDPVRAAQAIIDAAVAQNRPQRLLLGERAWIAAQAKLESLHRDFDAWKQITLSVDFPENER